MYAPVVALVITAIIGLIALGNWRWGFISIIVVGVMQDVLRKMTPDAPAYYIIWSMVIFGGVLLIALYRRSLGNLSLLWFSDKNLELAFKVYFFFILLQLLHGFLRWGLPAVPIFGAIFYYGPIVALLFVIGFSRNPLWINRFIRVYLIIMVPVCLTVYLSPILMDRFSVFKEVGFFTGSELLISSQEGNLYSYSGLLRVGEIAAFHAAVCIALITIPLYEPGPGIGKRIIYIAIIVALLGVIALTGRRKMLMALTLYWVFQFFLLNIFRRGLTQRLVLVFVFGLAVAVGFGVLSQGESTSRYLARGVSVFGSVGERTGTALNLLNAALERSSWLGFGAGSASSGLRYSGFDITRYIGYSSESGVGYIAGELGLPGLLIFVWLGFSFFRVIWRQLKKVSRISNQHLLRASSFVAFLAANVATFFTATQLYGDYFVLIVLGFFAGSLYVVIYDAHRKHLVARVRQYQIQQRRASTT